MIRSVIAASMITASLWAARAQTPSLEAGPGMQSVGNLHVNLASGLFEGKVCLLHRPLDALAAFSLNAGLNVARVTDADGHAVEFEGWYAPGVDGEARVYQVPSKPSSLCVTYVGSFPVYTAHDAPDDFKGVIAFNGDSVRATEQAAWLPTPFNTDRKSREGDTGYDLSVTCDGCRFVYLSGSPPVEQPNARLTTATLRPPLLFGGTGPITRLKDVTILNESVPPIEGSALSSTFGQIERFYSAYMGQDLADKPVLLRMITLNQVERDRRGSAWGFATWPTIALSGSVALLGRQLIAPDPKRPSPVPFLAHESAHYYFGTVDRPSGPYFWFLLESTAEFLSMKAEASIKGPASGKEHIARWSDAVAKDKSAVVAFDGITDPDQIGDVYRYDRGPLLLSNLESRAGEQKMKAFMRGLMVTPQLATWSDLKSVAQAAGITDEEWTGWQQSCVHLNSSACHNP